MLEQLITKRIKPLCEFTVMELKELLKAKSLSTAETESKLLSRVRKADPNGEWIMAERSNAESHGEQSKDANWASGETVESENTVMINSARTDMIQKEAELYRKEKELIESELAKSLAKREILILRQAQTGGGASVTVRGGHVKRRSGEHAQMSLEGGHAEEGAGIQRSTDGNQSIVADD